MREFNVEKRNTHFIRVEKPSSSGFPTQWRASSQQVPWLLAVCVLWSHSLRSLLSYYSQLDHILAGIDTTPPETTSPTKRFLRTVCVCVCVCVCLTVPHTFEWAPDVRRVLRFLILSYLRRLENLTLCKTVTAFVTFYKSSTFCSVMESPRVLVRPGFEPAASHWPDRRSSNWANRAFAK